MLSKLSLLASFLASTAAGMSLPATSKGMPCKAPAPSHERQAAFAEMASMGNISESLDARATVNVPTYIHIVAKSNSVADGYMSRATMNRQMKVINDDFANTGFQFVLQDVDWTINANWAADYDEMGMKNALRKGDYRTLNIYFLGSMFEHSGYCFYPVTTSAGEYDFVRDGCSIGAWTAPGRSAPDGNTRFSTGRIGTHEVGHWSGLIHTFDGNNCGGPGDYVDDTPAQAGPSDGCPVGRDSCPSQGLDPIHNHMDYTDDNCRTQFTPGQIQRMVDSYDYYRRNS